MLHIFLYDKQDKLTQNPIHYATRRPSTGFDDEILWYRRAFFLLSLDFLQDRVKWCD